MPQGCDKGGIIHPVRVPNDDGTALMGLSIDAQGEKYRVKGGIATNTFRPSINIPLVAILGWYINIAVKERYCATLGK